MSEAIRRAADGRVIRTASGKWKRCATGCPPWFSACAAPSQLTLTLSGIVLCNTACIQPGGEQPYRITGMSPDPNGTFIAPRVGGAGECRYEYHSGDLSIVAWFITSPSVFFSLAVDTGFVKQTYTPIGGGCVTPLSSSIVVNPAYAGTRVPGSNWECGPQSIANGLGCSVVAQGWQGSCLVTPGP